MGGEARRTGIAPGTLGSIVTPNEAFLNMSLRIRLQGCGLAVVCFVTLSQSLAVAQLSGRIRRLESRITIQKNTDVHVEQLGQVSLYNVQSPIVLIFNRARWNQEGQKWTASFQIDNVTIDGKARSPEVELSPDQARIILFRGNDYAIGDHTFTVSYTATSLFTPDGDYYVSDGHPLALRIDPIRGWPGLPVDSAQVKLVVPPDVSLNQLVLRAYTSVTPTSLKCDCDIDYKETEHSIVVATKEPIEETGYFKFELFFPSKTLRPNWDERARLLSQANPWIGAWGAFSIPVLAYLFVLSGLFYLKMKIPIQESRMRYMTGGLSFLAGAGSVASMFLLNQPYGAMPGFLVGVLVSMLVFGGAHGPKNATLLIPIAVVTQIIFYFVVAELWLSLMGRCRHRKNDEGGANPISPRS